MSENIFNTINAIVGDRGGGKTLYAIGSAYATKEKDRALGIEGFIDIYLKKKMKVLFIMTFPHPSYDNIPEIPFNRVFDTLHKWEEGVFKIVCPLYEIDRLGELLNEVIWNTAVFFEDTAKILGTTLKKWFQIFAIDSKNKNNDLYTMFHSWMQIPKEFFSMIDIFEIFKVGQHPECRKKEMQEYYDKILLIYNEVMENAFQFFHLTFFTDNNG